MCSFRVHLEKMVYQDIQARGVKQWVTFMFTMFRNVVKFSKTKWLIKWLRKITRFNTYLLFFKGFSRQEWPSWPLWCCWPTSKTKSSLLVFILFQAFTGFVWRRLVSNVHPFRETLGRQDHLEIEDIQVHQDLLVRMVYRELPVRRVPRWDFILIFLINLSWLQWPIDVIAFSDSACTISHPLGLNCPFTNKLDKMCSAVDDKTWFMTAICYLLAWYTQSSQMCGV